MFLLLVNLSLTFDIRTGMSRPWNTYNRNKCPSIELATFPLQLNNTFDINEAKSFLKKITAENANQIEDNEFDMDIISKFAHSHAHTSQPNFEEKFMKIKIDHYSMENDKTFDLRYLIKDTYFQKSIANTPILFYCGNEGGIEDFWKNSGFITETLAKEFKALVIFGEHRFFGKSFPLGAPQDYSIQKNKYLTVEQAMADFVELLRKFKQQNGIDESHPVIAFGGSYGGMLAAWSRMKFPHVYKGAVASSAPILLFEDIEKISNSFFKIVTETYKRYDAKCPVSIRQGFSTLESFKNSTLKHMNENIMNELNSIFNICTPIKNSTEIDLLEDTLEDALVALAQYNYPYETSFLNPTPGYPVKVACERIAKYKESSLLNGWDKLSPLMLSSISYTMNKFNQISPEMKDNLNYLKEAASVFFNYTGTQKCLDIGNGEEEKDEATPPNGWSYMACTEMVMPMQKNGVTDMFNPKKWDVEAFSNECKKTWNSDVRPDWAFSFFGGRNFEKEITNYSNILFTNGKMDPWNSGCPHFQSTSSVFIIEADSAHHLDLRLPNEKDPESIHKARSLTRELIKNWIIQ